MNSTLSEKKVNEARESLRIYNFTQAVAVYGKLVRQYPNKADIWFEYGAAATGAGQFDLADHAWRRAIELQPCSSHLMLQIGHQCQNFRQPEKARTWFEKATAADPKDINPRMALAILMERAHQFAEAREVIMSCLAIDSHDDQARYFAAVLDRRENKLTEAESRLRDLIRDQPRHPYVQYASRYELAEVLNELTASMKQ